MKLQTLREGLYMAHFNHIRGGKPLLALNVARKNSGRASVQAFTTCTIHFGTCKWSKRDGPCAAEGPRVGEAMCSHLDQFSRAKGRRLAFERAVNSLPRDSRAELWAAFLKVEGVPIKSKEKPHVSGHDNKA